MRRTLILILATAALVLGTATAATAHTTGPPSGEPLFCISEQIVISCFEQDGDDFWVYDNEPDGRSAVVLWRTSYGRADECRNSHGYGKWHECTYDMAEGNPLGSTTVCWQNYAVEFEVTPPDYNATSGTRCERISSLIET